MKLHYAFALVALPILFCTAGLAQSNEQKIDDSHHQAKLDEKADKAQTKADKKARKALKSDKVKDAAKAQDKADEKARKADTPQ